MNRNFKGIWIPAEIWLTKEMTTQEKLFYVEISSLDNEEGCFATNQYFADFFDISKTRVSLVIKSLKEKGFISSQIIYKAGTKQVEKRVLRCVNISEIPLFNKDCTGYLTNVKEGVQQKLNTPPQQKLKDNNTSFNNTLNNTSNINNNVVKDDNAPKEEKNKIPYKEIVEYLNLRTGKKFKHSTSNTRTNIKTRWNEGFNLEDFKKVIDVKTSQWINNPSMKQYLRPVTLFSNKFESYLNEEVKVNGKTSVGQYGDNQTTRQDAWTEHEAERARQYVERIGGKELDCDF